MLTGTVRSWLRGLMGLVAGAAVIYLNFFGIYHAFTKHGTGDGFASVFIPPFAWYRSVEFWWHDDFADVDWGNRLAADVRTAILLLAASVNPKPEQAHEISQVTEAFSAKIKRYPRVRFNDIRAACRLFLAYHESLAEDVVRGVRELRFDPSPKTLRLENSLRQYWKSTAEFSLMTSREEVPRLLNRLSNLQPDERARATELFLARLEAMLERMRATYDQVFGQSYMATATR